MVIEPGAEVNSRQIYESYEQWYEDNGGQKQTQRAVTAAVTRRYGESQGKGKAHVKGKRVNVSVWRGIRFRSED